MRLGVVGLVIVGGVLVAANPREVARARRQFEDALSKLNKLLKKRRAKEADLRKARKDLRAAIRKLASLNDPKAAKALLSKCINHPEFWVVRYTLEALKSGSTDEKTQDEIARFAARLRDVDTQFVVARICVGWKSRHVGRLFEQLADRGHWRLKVLAARGLAHFKTGSAKGRLERLLRDRNISVRLAAAASLLLLGYPKEKIPKQLIQQPFVEGHFLPKRLLTHRLIIMIDASNPMNTKMALTKEEIAAKLKELKKEQPKQPPKKGPQKQDKEEFYRRHFVVSRFEFAKLKVRKFIESLPKEMEIRVMFVSGAVEEFTKKGEALRLSDRTAMADFWKWFDRRGTYPGRDLVEAFRRAFADPLADTVLLVTCGGPDKSDIDDFEEFLKWFGENNFYRGLRVHVAALVADFNAAKLTQPEQVARQERIDRIIAFLTKLANSADGHFSVLSHVGKVAIPTEPQKKKPKKGAEPARKAPPSGKR